MVCLPLASSQAVNAAIAKLRAESLRWLNASLRVPRPRDTCSKQHLAHRANRAARHTTTLTTAVSSGDSKISAVGSANATSTARLEAPTAFVIADEQEFEPKQKILASLGFRAVRVPPILNAPPCAKGADHSMVRCVVGRARPRPRPGHTGRSAF